jgi:hypothetical protein
MPDFARDSCGPRRPVSLRLERILEPRARLASGVESLIRTRPTSAPVGTIAALPRISEFYGIVIEMYFADHPPPHFHARYGGDEATIAIATGDVLAGSLPRRALRLVREWLDAHRASSRPTGIAPVGTSSPLRSRP